MRQHGGLHARAADLVDGGGAGGVGQAGAAGGLAGGRLALAGGQDAAHQHLVDTLGRQGGTVERGADRVRAQSGGGNAGELALEAAERRARGGDDDDRIGDGHERILLLGGQVLGCGGQAAWAASALGCVRVATSSAAIRHKMPAAKKAGR